MATAKHISTADTAVKPEKEWLYRLVGMTGMCLCLLSVSLIAATVRDNILPAQFNKFMRAMYNASAEYGLYVEDIIVEGNHRTSYEDLVQALDLAENESILGIDISTLQSRIEQLTWVKECVVKRNFFPNNILVKIKERQIKAVWENSGHWYPIDSEGNVIETEDYEPDAPVLMLSGEGAPEHLTELLDVLAFDTELASRVRAAIYVSNRRWNLVFGSTQNGIVVKLPEKDFDKAYEKIALLNKRQGIFKRKLTSFDIRYDNRIIVDIDKSVEDLMMKR